MIEVRNNPNVQFQVKVGKAKAGLGLFALEPIPKGKKIIEYIGRVFINEPDDAIDNLYIFRVNSHIDIDGSPRFNTARYINHSCRPNAESEVRKGRVWIIAKRNIALGEEITYDYGKEYWKEYIEPKGCRCPKCALLREKVENGAPVSDTRTQSKKSERILVLVPEYTSTF